MKRIVVPWRPWSLPGAGFGFPTTRILLAAGAFLLALVVDRLTGQRYSSIWGSLAIAGSMIALFPAIRPLLAAFATYAGIWVAFNLTRAVADDAGIGMVDLHTVSRLEAEAAGARLPSALLQDWLFPGEPRLFDGVMTGVYASFFVAPTMIAGLLWWKRRGDFHRYVGAITLCFGGGLAGFFLLPTAPPWMSEPADVRRVVPMVIAKLGVGDGATVASGDRFSFEPNHLAAFPSVHVAVTVLIFMAVRRWGTVAGILAMTYSLAMTVAVVYLGEHFVIDAVLGWLVAILAWRISPRVARDVRDGQAADIR